MSPKILSVIVITSLAMFGSTLAKPGYASHGHGYDVDYYVSFTLRIIKKKEFCVYNSN